MPAWAISVLVHVIAILILALFVTEPPRKPPVVAIVASTSEPDEAFEDLAIEIPEETPIETTDPVADVDMTTDVVVENVQTVSDASDVEAAPLAVDLADFGAATAPAADLLATIGAAGGVGATGLGGRKNARNMALAGGAARTPRRPSTGRSSGSPPTNSAMAAGRPTSKTVHRARASARTPAAPSATPVASRRSGCCHFLVAATPMRKAPTARRFRRG